MPICILTHPSPPEIPNFCACVERSHLVLKNYNHEIIDDFPLPHPPKGIIPEILPLIQEKKTLFVIGKTLHLAWDLENHTTQGWQQETIPLSEIQILNSLITNPYPHQKFLQECLLARKLEISGEGALPDTPWPLQLHSGWLTILENTKAKQTNFTIPKPPNSIFIPTHPTLINTLIGAIKRGIVVSMAIRSPEELPLAKKILCTQRNHKPKDNTWKSLAQFAETL